jgi:hypothetical protein
MSAGGTRALAAPTGAWLSRPPRAVIKSVNEDAEAATAD